MTQPRIKLKSGGLRLTLGRQSQLRLLLIPLVLASTGVTEICHAAHYAETRIGARPAFRRMAAEFEQQSALLLGWVDSDFETQDVIVRIVEHGHRSVPILILVNNQMEHLNASIVLEQACIPTGAVRLIRAPIDSPWARDYGPTVVRSESATSLIIDAVYGTERRPNDDRIPLTLAGTCSCRAETTELRIEGGNLLTNGCGLGIATTRLIDHNTAAGYSVNEISSTLREVYGLRETVFLEPLRGEDTRHVDMFATFTAPDTVIIGSYDTDDDPVNADILDRNAERLSGIQTPRGPLRIVRLPMPRRSTDSRTFPTWTNVVFANNMLMMPSYSQLDPTGEARAVRTYKQLLPGWKIQKIDCSLVIEHGGALHCLTMNLPDLPILPLSDSVDDTDSESLLPVPIIDPFATFSYSDEIPWTTRLQRIHDSTLLDSDRRMFVQDFFPAESFPNDSSYPWHRRQ